MYICSEGVVVMSVMELDLMKVEIKALRQNELDLKSGSILVATPILQGASLDGVEVQLTNKIAFTVYSDGRLELGALDVRKLCTYNLAVADDVSSVHKTADDTVQSLLMGLIHLMNSTVSGSVRCSLLRLSLLEKIILNMLERTLGWRVVYEDQHVSVVIEGNLAC